MPDQIVTGGTGPGPRGLVPLVSSVTAINSSVAVIGGDVHGDIIFGGELLKPIEQVRDFQTLIDSVTRGFVGRRDVFAALASFREKYSRGYFDIVADAGLGKTALAAEIAKRFDALSFFAGRGLTQPKQFLTHLCAALITRYALPYDHLPARAGEDETFLSKLLREAAAARRDPIWIVVDGLDEAETPPPGANPLLLPPQLPDGVFVIVTHRPPGRLWTRPDTPRVAYALKADAPQQAADVEEYVRMRAEADGPIKNALERTRPRIATDTFVRRLVGASRGNFMYLSFVLGDVEAGENGGAMLDLDRLPDGLEKYYENTFWANIEAKKADWAEWKTLYRAVIERLAVAAEPVSAEWLGTQIGRDADEVRDRVLLPWTRFLSHDAAGGHDLWRVVHRSFADFLATKVDVPAAHRAVGSYYATQLWNQWAAFDDYGLRHTPFHLAAGAAAEPDPAERHATTESLVALVLAPGYQERYLAQLRDPAGFERALDLTLTTIANDASASVARVAELALDLGAFRKNQRKPEPIFDLAHAGDLEAAERRLDLFALDVGDTWYQALLLVVAWLGASPAAEKARALRDRVAMSIAGAPPSATLQLLLARVGATLDATPLPMRSLPPPRPPEELRAILLRLGASAVDRSLMSSADVELMNRREPVAGTRGYLAETDGPDLVAAVVAEPGVGEPLLHQYVAMHAAYGYREYRQGSLWVLLDAVLQHPSQAWVQNWATALGVAVLAPSRGEFRESVGLATLALQAAAGEPGAVDALNARRTEAVDAAASAEPLPVMNVVVDPPPPGQGDTWGIHRRRFAALAEAFSRVPGQQSSVQNLVDRALGLQWGFAGFNAPARLALAGAIEVSMRDAALAPGAIAQALDGALVSAHNIQDAVFCARTTARVDALTRRWSTPTPGGFDVDGCAARLADDPSTPEFATDHVVGQSYLRRNPETTIPLPPALLEAATLTQLATVYQRPLADFQRLNGDLAADAQLPPGTPVNVPDPGFPPLLAARFAARALSDMRLSPEDQQRVIRTLVPIAAADPTALDLVLSRLVLASHPDRTVLATLAALAARTESPAAPDAALGAQLTRFIP